MGTEEVKEEAKNYSERYMPKRDVRMIKKDGTREAFNVQKVIDAVGKSAYRALTKFTEEEKEFICQKVVDRVDELDVDEIPIPVMHNIVESALEQVKPIVAKSYRDYILRIAKPFKHIINSYVRFGGYKYLFLLSYNMSNQFSYYCRFSSSWRTLDHKYIRSIDGTYVCFRLSYICTKKRNRLVRGNLSFILRFTVPIKFT